MQTARGAHPLARAAARLAERVHEPNGHRRLAHAALAREHEEYPLDALHPVSYLGRIGIGGGRAVAARGRMRTRNLRCASILPRPARLVL